MKSTWISVFTIIGFICQHMSIASSSDNPSWQQTSLLLKRLRRDGWGDSWSVIMPPVAARKCYAEPCSFDSDCCLGYKCTSFDEVARRSGLVQYCTPEDEPELPYYR